MHVGFKWSRLERMPACCQIQTRQKKKKVESDEDEEHLDRTNYPLTLQAVWAQAAVNSSQSNTSSVKGLLKQCFPPTDTVWKPRYSLHYQHEPDLFQPQTAEINKGSEWIVLVWSRFDASRWQTFQLIMWCGLCRRWGWAVRPDDEPAGAPRRASCTDQIHSQTDVEQLYFRSENTFHTWADIFCGLS